MPANKRIPTYRKGAAKKAVVKGPQPFNVEETMNLLRGQYLPSGFPLNWKLGVCAVPKCIRATPLYMDDSGFCDRHRGGRSALPFERMKDFVAKLKEKKEAKSSPSTSSEPASPEVKKRKRVEEEEEEHDTATTPMVYEFSDAERASKVVQLLSTKEIKDALIIDGHPKGVPSDWMLGVCAFVGCSVKVSKDMSGDGYCGRHNCRGYSPIPFDEIKKVVADFVLKPRASKIAHQQKRQKTGESSASLPPVVQDNKSSISRPALKQVSRQLAVVQPLNKKRKAVAEAEAEAESDSAKRQRLVEAIDDALRTEKAEELKKSQELEKAKATRASTRLAQKPASTASKKRKSSEMEDTEAKGSEKKKTKHVASQATVVAEPASNTSSSSSTATPSSPPKRRGGKKPKVDVPIDWGSDGDDGDGLDHAEIDALAEYDGPRRKVFPKSAAGGKRVFGR